MSATAYRHAMEAGDLDGVAASFAPDAVLNSPVTMRHQFKGREELRQVFAAVLEVVDEIAYAEEVAEGVTHVIFGSGRVRGERIEETIQMRLNEAGLIAEMTLYVRPMPGLLALAAALAPRVGPDRRRSRLAGAMVVPLAAAAKSGERLATRLVWPR